jgi:hypothetical protein
MKPAPIACWDRIMNFGAGRAPCEMRLATIGAVLGGNVGVGLEDSLSSWPRPTGTQQRRASQQDSPGTETLNFRSPRPTRRAPADQGRTSRISKRLTA